MFCTITPRGNMLTEAVTCHNSGYLGKRLVPLTQFRTEATSKVQFSKILHGQFIRIFMIREEKYGMSFIEWSMKNEKKWSQEERQLFYLCRTRASIVFLRISTFCLTVIWDIKIPNIFYVCYKITSWCWSFSFGFAILLWV